VPHAARLHLCLDDRRVNGLFCREGEAIA
jgi:hypothetical protein